MPTKGSKGNDFFTFVQALPKNHRYFFITQIHPNSIDDKKFVYLLCQ